MVPLPQSIGLERVVEIPILLTSKGTFPSVSFRGKQTPATGVNKCSNPDEGTLNEVSSLANEKFISSRNKYGAKGKAVLVSVLEARHCIQVCWAAHKMNELVAQDNKLTCRGVYIKQPPSQATT